MRLALYEPDIPQNTGAILRLGACLGVAVDVIEPCGFVWDDRRLRRAGLDYLEGVELSRHRSWRAYQERRAAAQDRASGAPGRLLLLTTKGDQPYGGFRYRPGDSLLLGRESAGVPEEVQAAADARLVIPLRPGLRSLNVALAAAMVLGEALRQLEAFPRPGDRGNESA
jgi:tRNA (cytidine/uridine-2'-O-)-methyltransferase